MMISHCPGRSIWWEIKGCVTRITSWGYVACDEKMRRQARKSAYLEKVVTGDDLLTSPWPCDESRTSAPQCDCRRRGTRPWCSMVVIVVIARRRPRRLEIPST